MSDHCTWPGCQNRRVAIDYAVAGAYDGFAEVPLCTAHMFEVWRICRDQANARNIRETKAEVVVNGRRKTVERPVSTVGWVYYLRIGDHIKVGYASKLATRLKAYPPNAEFLYAHRGTKQDEKVAHSMLHAHKAAGREWFDPAPEVFDWIERQKARYGPTRDPRPKKQPEPVVVRSKAPARIIM